MQFVRQSKFRHVFCKPLKTEFCLADIRITKISHDSTFCSANSKFIAIITEGSGGPFMVLPIGKQGRVEKDYPLVDAHRGACLEVAWNPFNDHVIASGSEDTTVKVWMIPENGLRRPLKEPIVELVAHQRRVTTLVWHPTANNVLLTAGGDLKIFVWNVGTGEALIEMAGHPDLIWGISFNYNGSKIVTTCKDKKIRVIDPRSGKILQQGQGHEGMKPQRAVYTKNGQIFTTGFTKRSERLYALRNEDDLENPIVQEELDTSNGVMFPFYDGDTGLVYLTGKGDNNIRYFEINSDPPFIHYINIYTSSEPQRGVAFMPKRGLKIMENETARIYKVTNKGTVEVLQFYVPRKSELFQDDLYPDTPGVTPAITAEEWIDGKDSDPVLVSLAPDGRSGGSGLGMGGMGNTSLVSPSGGGARAAKKTNLLAQVPAPAAPADPPSSTSPRMDSLNAAGSSGNNNATSDDAVPLRKLSPGGASRAEQALSELRNSNQKAPTSSSTARSQSSFEDSPFGPPRSTQPSQDYLPPPSPGLESRRAGARESVSSTTSGILTRDDVIGRGGGSSGGGGGGGRGGPSPSSTPSQSSPNTRQSTPTPSNMNLEELISDISKLKAVLRRHEKRIRYLEDTLANRDMDGLLD